MKMFELIQNIIKVAFVENYRLTIICFLVIALKPENVFFKIKDHITLSLEK